MRFKLNIRKEVKAVVAIFAVLSLIAFAERQHQDVTCSNVVIQIENIEDNHFVDEDQVMSLISGTGVSIVGNSINRLNLRAIEAKLETDNHIQDAQLYVDLSGNLVVNVTLRRAVARLIRTDGSDLYVAEDGAIMYTSEKFSSRVLLISGEFVRQFALAESILESEQGGALLEMINFINGEKFWRAQIAQLDIDGRGKIILYPQVTGQLVEFGTVDNYEEKLKKLMIFYKEILPQRGWTKYARVNVEYEDQVIAE